MVSRAKIREAKRQQRRIQRELTRVENAGGRSAVRHIRSLFKQAQSRLEQRSKRALSTLGLTKNLEEAVVRSMEVGQAIGERHAEGILQSPAVKKAEANAKLELSWPGEILELQAGDDDLQSMIKSLRKRRRARRSVLGDAIDMRAQYRKLSRQAVRDSIESLATRLMNTVTDSITGGMHLRDGRKALRKTILETGGLQPGDHILNTLFRTHSQMAYQGARWAELEQNANTLWGFLYSTVGDERVRAEHVAIDGVTLPTDDRRWKILAPPNGWNCRCWLIPLFDAEPLVIPRTGWGVDKGFRVNWGQKFLAT